MLKKNFLILFFLLSFAILPSIAGDFEDAIKNQDNVFLYLFSPDCKYCQLFKPNYEKLVKNYNKELVFVKADTSTMYGQKLFYIYGGKYVPYAAIISGKTKQGLQISPPCLLKYQCLESAVKGFKENNM